MAILSKAIYEDSISLPDYLTTEWERAQWINAKELHEKKIANTISAYLSKREQQQNNPIFDFLFEYYQFPPSKLQKWSPGFGNLLHGYKEGDIHIKELANSDGYAWLDRYKFKTDKVNSLIWIKQLLESTASHKPSMRCLGMHEWAMVYQSNAIRHSYLPLRFSKQKIDAIVDKHPLLCTHYDAFRFFTRSAKPQNAYSLSRQKFSQNEQPGCIHTNMDLYKWAFKYYPWISSAIIRKAFLLALEARTVDMRASPYDLTKFGLSAIKVETAEGKKEYAARQKEIYKKSQPIRQELISEYDYLITCLQ